MTNYKFVGQLLLANKQDVMDYGVYVQNKTTFYSLTKLFNTILNTQDPRVSFSLTQTDNGHVIDVEGRLHITEDQYGVPSFHIGSFPVETYIDELVGEQVVVEIVATNAELEDVFDDEKQRYEFTA